MCVLALNKLRQYLTSFQAIFRGVSVRSQMQKEIDATVTIQNWYFARKAELYHISLQAALNHRWRRQDTLFSESSVSLHDLGDENSTIDVTREYQLCSILTFPADKTEISATIVQTAYRRYDCRQCYSKIRASVVTIQRAWRLYSSQARHVCTRAVEIGRASCRERLVWCRSRWSPYH